MDYLILCATSKVAIRIEIDEGLDDIDPFWPLTGGYLLYLVYIYCYDMMRKSCIKQIPGRVGFE